MDTWTGAACALSSAAIWAYSATFITPTARVFGGRATNLFKSTVGAISFLLAILVLQGPGALDASAGSYARFAASGLLGLAIADTAYLSALGHIGPFLTALVYQTSGIITVALGMASLGETLSVAEAAGIAAVILGVVLAVGSRPHGPVERGHRTRGVVYALVSATFHAVGVVFNKDAFRELGVADGMDRLAAATFGGFVRMTTAAAALLVLAVVGGSAAELTRLFRDPAGRRAAFLPAFFGTFVAMLTMQLALASLKSGVASVLLSMTPIFTLPIAWRVLKERPTRLSAGGAAVALVGAWLLAQG
jgi:drug/metabolite transporter (DMT)-like permease